jgi:hypothetical protein
MGSPASFVLLDRLDFLWRVVGRRLGCLIFLRLFNLDPMSAAWPRRVFGWLGM